ncbi:MAG TPA: CopG family transcriptional regulator [Actinobacteria bacterium]|nr:CopG family transcriptional regulator [Actinomycetota bacterium]
MARTAKTLGFSVPPNLKKEVERIAKQEGMTKSELFREMLRAYKQIKAEQEFFSLQRRVSQRAREKGVFTEEDIEKLVLGGR